MRYLIMHGNSFSMNNLPARTDRAEAEAEVQRLETLRKKRNEEAKAFVYRERGDAFRAPRYDQEHYWIKEIDDETD